MPKIYQMYFYVFKTITLISIIFLKKTTILKFRKTYLILFFKLIILCMEKDPHITG